MESMGRSMDPTVDGDRTRVQKRPHGRLDRWNHGERCTWEEATVPLVARNALCGRVGGTTPTVLGAACAVRMDQVMMSPNVRSRSKYSMDIT